MHRGWEEEHAPLGPGPRGTLARLRGADGRGDLVELLIGEYDRGRSDPAFHLRRSARTHDGAGDARPGEGPGDGNRGHRRFPPLRDGAKRVPEPEVPVQLRLLEVRGTSSPVVLRKRGCPIGAEAVRQQARMHRTVNDDPGFVARAPGNLPLGCVAIDEREGWLKGIDMPDPLTPIEQAHIEIGNSGCANLPLFDQLRHLGPRILDGGARLVGPVELVEIDTVDSESPQRCLAFAPDRRRLQVGLRWGHPITVVPDETALCEDEWALGCPELSDKPPDQLLGMSQSVDGSGIDPVHPQLERVAHGGERFGVVLWAPAEGPAATSDRPGAESDPRDVQSAPTELTRWQCHRCDFSL